MPPKEIQLPKLDQSDISAPINFQEIESRVFTEVKGQIYIGRELVRPDVLGALKDQAHNFKTTELYDVFMATIKNEAANLALIQSKDWDNVTYAKAMWHFQYVFENMLNVLDKK